MTPSIPRAVAFLVLLASLEAVAGPPVKGVSVEQRDQLARATGIVVAVAGPVSRCAEEPAATCARVTLKIERTLKGQLSGEVTVRADRQPLAKGRAVYLTAETTTGPWLTGRVAASVAQVEATLAQVCATAPEHRRPCSELGAVCEAGPQECLCSMRPTGIAVARAPAWECQARGCLGVVVGSACDGAMQCQWFACSNGRWAAVPPPP